MLSITKQIRTETGHRLCNYEGRCAHVHGHSYLWEITVEGEMDDRGMVADFKDLKQIMTEVIDPLDHAFVISPEDPFNKLMAYRSHVEGGCYDITLEDIFTATNGEEPRLFVWHENPTAESMAQWAAKEIQRLLPLDIMHVTKVRVWETATSFAEWNK